MFSFVIIAVFLFVSCCVQAKCPNRVCEVPTDHYTELGCTPVYKGHKPCPAYFNCPNIENRCPDKCYYRGEVYNENEEIRDASEYATCVAACFCSTVETARIICAVYDCAPPPTPSEPIEGCYHAVDHSTCCPNRLICPPFDNIANCSVNGTIYYEGQRFTAPTNTKLNCICKRDFQGQYVEPFCRPANCAIEIYNEEAIRQKCAPVFSKDSVCPISWQCDENTGNSSTVNTPGVKCLYGNSKLNIGDKVMIESNNVKCECLIPPLLTCYEF